MIQEELISSVSRYVFAEDGATTYAVLDGASVPDLLDKLYSQLPEFVCLYRGEQEPDMAEVAPYLVRLDPDSEFSDWLIGRGWGNQWGIFAQSRADIRAMRRHLRGLLVVYDADGRPLRFRYYDPRVLRKYLPTCNAEELGVIFGPVACYTVEDESPNTLLRFSLESGSLRQEKIRSADR
ncbi:MAG TPA: DUF4123 domain-containing protein [Blastocatellia bacterium]|nr:DUF4123 domain-containing protein [Blastocatellia bacterium]